MSEFEAGQHKADLDALKALQADVAELERIESLLDRFNIFETLGFVEWETMHSRFLAFLLDPNRSYGLGNSFLRGFLQEVSEGVNRTSGSQGFDSIGDRGLSQTTVQTEVYTDDGRIDILLLNEVGQWAIIVENKIGTTEHSDQLDRYYQFVKTKHPGWEVFGVYLTPYGAVPSRLEDREKYRPLSYGAMCQIMNGILEDEVLSLSPDVRMSLEHYLGMVRRHILGDPEIVRLCQQLYKRHKRAFDLIYEHRPDVLAEIRPVVEDLIKQEPRLELDLVRKDNIKFVVQEWDKPALLTAQNYTPSGRILLFEVWNRPGNLDVNLFIGPGPEAIRERLLEMVRINSVFFRKPRKVGDKWLLIFSRPLLKQEAYADAEREDREQEIRDQWGAFLKEDLPQIEAALKKETWIWEPVEPDERT